jgi:hypothetical protein
VSAALVVVALVVSGVPLSVLISPILVAGAAVLVRLADLVASVPPDLTAWFDRAFAEILSVLQTWGLVALLLEAPFLRSARASLRFILRTAAGAVRGDPDASTRELALDQLLAGAGHEHGMDSEELERLPTRSRRIFGNFRLGSTRAPGLSWILSWG